MYKLAEFQGDRLRSSSAFLDLASMLLPNQLYQLPLPWQDKRLGPMSSPMFTFKGGNWVESWRPRVDCKTWAWRSGTVASHAHTYVDTEAKAEVALLVFNTCIAPALF